MYANVIYRSRGKSLSFQVLFSIRIVSKGLQNNQLILKTKYLSFYKSINNNFNINYLDLISDELPPQQMMEAVKKLVEFGVSKGFIAENYTLLGHRQVRDTECPGTKLFDEISKWPHFSKHPDHRRDNFIPIQ